jgi:hypothetical protein
MYLASLKINCYFSNIKTLTMKILTLCFLLTISSLFAKAQLANTKWAGTAAVPDPTDITLTFKKDTLNMSLKGSNDIIESMTYTVKGDVITVKKVSGGSPCEAGSESQLKYAIKGDQLTITVIADVCAARQNAWPPDPFVKIKE